MSETQATSRTIDLLAQRTQHVPRGISNAVALFVESAQGAEVTDIEGNRYLDFAGGIGVQNIGHGNSQVVEAVKAQAEKFLHTCFSVMMYEPYIQLAEKMNALIPGDFPKKTMFLNSGAEAIENAVKIARYATKRSAVITFDGAYHGRTLLTMTMTSKVEGYKKGFGPFAPEIYKVPYAYCYRCPIGLQYPTCEVACAGLLKQALKVGVAAESVAAVVIEPVQGEGGFIVPPPEYLPKIAEICRAENIPLIVDEVQTGFGRTGRMFAMQHGGVEADMVVTAKSLAAGLPLSAVTGRAEMMDAPPPGGLGGTYSGNPVALAAALAVLEVFEQNDIEGWGQRIGQRIISRFQEMQQRFPAIGDVRGLGAMVAMELVKDRQTKEPDKELAQFISRYAQEHGLILIRAGLYDNVIRVLVPLVATDEQLERGLDIIQAALEAGS